MSRTVLRDLYRGLYNKKCLVGSVSRTVLNRADGLLWAYISWINIGIWTDFIVGITMQYKSYSNAYCIPVKQCV